MSQLGSVAAVCSRLSQGISGRPGVVPINLNSLAAARTWSSLMETRFRLLSQSRGLFGGRSYSERIAKLQRAVSMNPYDSHAHAQLLREMNKHEPQNVVKHVNMMKERGLPIRDGVLDEYGTACAKVLETSTEARSVDAMKAGGAFSGNVVTNSGRAGESTVGMMEGMAMEQALKTGRPIQVEIAPPSTKTQMWRTLRFVGGAFLLISAAGVIMDERGLSRGVSYQQEYQAPSQDEKCFDDVKGVDEAKNELQEIVMYLKDPKRFTRLGGKLPKGVMLVGPPGTGKTLLARSIAGEARVPFFYASGSEFEEMYVGVGARRVRDLFNVAKRKSPCIVFIDEIDAIGGTRHLKDQQAMKMTLNQLLVELDGFAQNEGIIVIAATNFPETLDKALTRPGRFDQQVVVPLPDVSGRRQIIEMYMKKVAASPSLDAEYVARGTPGFSGADLANLVNVAALRASILGKDSITMEEMDYARDKILMGVERKTAVISEENKKLTAYHEGGHALVAYYTKHADPIHKATVMPRGMALGMVQQIPDKDQSSMSRGQMLARLDVCMGGRVAEELIFGPSAVTSGASSDLQQATRLAQAMVKEWGLSDKVGPVYVDSKNVSPETMLLIESEVRKLIEDASVRARKILTDRQKELHRLANALVEHETLTRDEITQVLKGNKIQRPSPK